MPFKAIFIFFNSKSQDYNTAISKNIFLLDFFVFFILNFTFLFFLSVIFKKNFHLSFSNYKFLTIQ